MIARNCNCYVLTAVPVLAVVHHGALCCAVLCCAGPPPWWQVDGVNGVDGVKVSK